ncbi:MAG TPA: hypothetical protein VFS05_07570, partial [Gemmatimonadaceae bacterium]|nr:hypothetical protein [Gemmatimonadaceae bacterium]
GDYGVSFKRSYSMSRRFYRAEMPFMAPLLRQMRAPDGILAVLGNHDHYYNAPAVRAWLEECGIRVLVNERVELCRGDARLAIAGVDDEKTGQVDPMAGCESLDPGVPVVLLSHNPDGVLKLSPKVKPGLVLSGHTHGGQVVLPFYGAPIRFSRIGGRHHARGWIPNHVAPLFVSAGVGSQVPLRLNCDPDVLIVRLRAVAGGAAGEE